LSLAVTLVTDTAVAPGVVTFHRSLAPCIHAIAASTNRTIVHVPISTRSRHPAQTSLTLPVALLRKKAGPAVHPLGATRRNENKAGGYERRRASNIEKDCGVWVGFVCFLKEDITHLPSKWSPLCGYMEGEREATPEEPRGGNTERPEERWCGVVVIVRGVRTGRGKSQARALVVAAALS
jgi:hypothetical protein